MTVGWNYWRKIFGGPPEICDAFKLFGFSFYWRSSNDTLLSHRTFLVPSFDCWGRARGNRACSTYTGTAPAGGQSTNRRISIFLGYFPVQSVR